MTRKSSTRSPAGPSAYRITVRGQLDPHWSEWFDGLAVTRDEDDNTVLCGSIPDQAALRSILLRIFDLGLTLLSVNRAEPE